LKSTGYVERGGVVIGCVAARWRWRRVGSPLKRRRVLVVPLVFRAMCITCERFQGEQRCKMQA
jgi:hypothetical protein